MHGIVAGYRLAGIEPDGDPLDQVLLQTRLSPSAGLPVTRLIVSSYLENFKPDTTPILPDLLHPNSTAQNLGGFLQGKALLTDDAGNVLYIGSFLGEAFLDNSNHAVMTLFGTNAGYGGQAKLKGIFRLRKDGSLNGTFTGRIALPAAARRQIMANRGAPMKPLKQIISVVTVRPAAMVGRKTARSVSVPLHTGFGSPTSSASTGMHISTLTIVAAVGAVLSLLMGGFLFWFDHRRQSSA
jgi:hypothetical protein